MERLWLNSFPVYLPSIYILACFWWSALYKVWKSPYSLKHISYCSDIMLSVPLIIAVPVNWFKTRFRCDLSICFWAHTTDSTNGAKVKNCLGFFLNIILMDLVVCPLTAFTHWSKWVNIKQYDMWTFLSTSDSNNSFLQVETD